MRLSGSIKLDAHFFKAFRQDASIHSRLKSTNIAEEAPLDRVSNQANLALDENTSNIRLELLSKHPK